MPAPEAVVFDAYGTLLDVNAAMARHAERLGASWGALSAEWRAKQLEYTWVRSLTGAAHHEDFWLCTREALDFVFARNGIVDRDLAKDLMEAYRTLPAYPEVPAMLEAVRARGVTTAILSNGTPAMLDAAIASAGLGALIDATLSVDSVPTYKVDARAYQLAVDALGVAAADISFQSSNRWDVAGAAAFGFRAVWVNRAGAPDEYPDLAPVAVICSLSELPALA